jgi:hypothetical protein
MKNFENHVGNESNGCHCCDNCAKNALVLHCAMNGFSSLVPIPDEWKRDDSDVEEFAFWDSHMLVLFDECSQIMK